MNEGQIDDGVEALKRIGMVLGALYASHLGELGQESKALRLSHCGFSNGEIADILGTTTNAINVGLHRVRKGKRKSASGRNGRKSKQK